MALKFKDNKATKPFDTEKNRKAIDKMLIEDVRAELLAVREALHEQTPLLKLCASAMNAFNVEIADIDASGALSDAVE